MNTCAAVFLDLQGTLGGEGLADIRDFSFFPSAFEALRLLNVNNLPAIVITNQSNIGKRLFTYAQYEHRVEELRQQLSGAKVSTDAIYCCPHRPDALCACQKPRLGLLIEAERAFQIDLKQCYVVGDWGSVDMLMARNAGCKGVLVRTGVGETLT